MTKRLDLPRRYRDQIETLLREHVPGVEVWAYGSRVTGKSHKGSDLDLVLRGPDLKRIPSGQLMDLIEALEESNIPIIVQAHDWARLPESFHREIEREYVVLVEREEWGSGNETLADFVNITMGQSPPGNTVLSMGGIPLLNGPTEFGPHHPTPTQFTTSPRKYAHIGDILFCVRGSTTGRMNWADQEYAIGRGIAAIRHRWAPKLQPFVRAVIEFELPGLLAQATGSTFPNVSAAQLAAIPYPNLSGTEQRAIAHILGTLDDKIELNRRMNETLEEMARALFKSWFVDFDPVRAKMEGRDNGLPPDIADLFPDRLVDSELGEIPEGWEVKRLNDFAALNPESWSQTNHPKGVEYVDLANTKWGVIEATQYYFWKDAPSRAKRVLRSGDTIVGTVRPGNGSYSLVGHEGLTGSTGFAVLRPIHPRYRGLVYLSATSAKNIKRLAHHADGAAYLAVRPNVVEETRIVTPRVDNEILTLFSMTVSPIINRTESNKTESRILATLRDVLLPKLVSGEIRVTETE